MSAFLENRERAAEYGYTHEELRFQAQWEGLIAMAKWASGAIGRADPAGADYAEALVSQLVGGASLVDIVARVEDDLGKAGRADLGSEAGACFAWAAEKASNRLHGRLAIGGRPEVPLVARPAASTHGFWGWTV